MTMIREATSESAIRSRAQRRGFIVRKSRQHALSADNLGDYMLLDARTNFLVLGLRYDATLEQIDEYLEVNTR